MSAQTLDLIGQILDPGNVETCWNMLKLWVSHLDSSQGAVGCWWHLLAVDLMWICHLDSGDSGTQPSLHDVEICISEALFHLAGTCRCIKLPCVNPCQQNEERIGKETKGSKMIQGNEGNETGQDRNEAVWPSNVDITWWNLKSLAWTVTEAAPSSPVMPRHALCFWTFLALFAIASNCSFHNPQNDRACHAWYDTDWNSLKFASHHQKVLICNNSLSCDSSTWRFSKSSYKVRLTGWKWRCQF